MRLDQLSSSAIDLGQFDSTDAATAAWQAADLPPGRSASATIAGQRVLISSDGQIVPAPGFNSSAGERPPRAPVR